MFLPLKKYYSLCNFGVMVMAAAKNIVVRESKFIHQIYVCLC